MLAIFRHILIFAWLSSGLSANLDRNGAEQKKTNESSMSNRLNFDENNLVARRVINIDSLFKVPSANYGQIRQRDSQKSATKDDWKIGEKKPTAAPKQNDPLGNDNLDRGAAKLLIGKETNLGHDDEVAEDAQAAEKSDTVQIGLSENVTFILKEEDIIEAANFGLQAMNDLYYIKEPNLYLRGLFLDTDNPAKYVAAFNDQTEEARMLARFGYASIEAAKAFKRKFPEISRQGSFIPISPESDLHKQCPKRGIPQCKTASLRYRTADGSCNNQKHLWWGSSMSAMQRFMPAVYQDGIESVRLSVTGAPLPSARDVSNFIHEDRDIPLASVTHMLMQWGQFVDHDITATGQSRGFNGTVPQCCARGGVGFQPPELMHPECLPIAISQSDTFYGRIGVRCLEFIRSTLAPKEGCEFGFREQINQVTSYLDASTVYSSNARQSDSLRLKRNGLLQYGRVQARMPVLPRDNSDLCRQGTLATSCFKAGDGRLSEQPALTSLHIVFLRLHNRIATQLSALNQHWNDEKLFQETRKIVGAIIQHITYREFLPIVLGPDVMKIFDLEILKSGYYTGYDSNVNPDIANEFSTAAYRFGHSLVQNSFVRFDKAHRPIFNNVSIHEEFSNPVNLHTAGALDRIILGLINQPSQRRDEFIVSELTNHLFQTPRFAFGMDLASLNIQRGRDHGIAPYVQWRVPCELSPVKTWEDLELATSTDTMMKFRTIYRSVEDIDLFPAGLAEKPLKGGLVGPTFACIIAQQFSNLRKGDRFWFENPHIQNSFTLSQLQQIRKITLAQVLCRTMDNVDSVQPFVMLTADNRKNQRRSCLDRAIAGFNLEPWKELEFDMFDKSPVVVGEFTDDETKIINEQSVGRKPSKNDEQRFVNKRIQNPFSKPTPPKPQDRHPPMRQRPLKTKINQQNRIAVKRPLSPGENVTIFVQNNAVNAPIFLNNAHISNSNIQINQLSTSTAEPEVEAIQTPASIQKPSAPSCNSCSLHNSNTYPAMQIPKPISKPYSNNFKPYIPYNFNDPNNPNPPHYGYNANPMNNYIPNNLYFYSMVKPYFYHPQKPNFHQPLYNFDYNPHFQPAFFDQPSGFSKIWMEESGEENKFGWINVTSSERITVEQEQRDSTYVPGTQEKKAQNANEDLVVVEDPINVNSSSEKQSPKYRFESLWKEKKLTIEELIQHTQLPLNPIGVIESDAASEKYELKKIKGVMADESFGINQGIMVGNKEGEKTDDWKNVENNAKPKGVVYFDENIRQKYPGNVENSPNERTAYKSRANLTNRGQCLNKRCGNGKDADLDNSDAMKRNLKIKMDFGAGEFINEKLITPVADFNDKNDNFFTKVNSGAKERIKINRLSESELSLDDNFLEMPLLSYEQTAFASELPKPMKLDLYL